MNTYIGNFLDKSCKSFDLYSLNDGLITSEYFSDIEELKYLDDNCSLVMLIPSILVTSYKNSKKLGLSEDVNLANFISEIDNKIVDQISNNKFFFHGDNAFVINKALVQDLNKALTQLDANVILLPEYSFFGLENSENVIFELNSKFIFLNSNGTGSSVTKNTLEQYCQLISDNKDDYNPLIYSDDGFLKEKYPNSSFITSGLESFFAQDLKKLPNFYSFYFSYHSLKNKFNFNVTQSLIMFIGLFSLLFLPSMLIKNNNNDALAYKEATFNIFTTINKDINKVVRPRSQIDSIMNQVPVKRFDDVKLPDLAFLDQIGEEYIDRIYVNFYNTTVLIDINNMPIIQYNFIKKLSQQFGISIIDEEITSLNSIVSGSLTASFINE